MVGCNSAVIHEKLILYDEVGFADAKVFRSLVGALIYLMHTHPDITFSIRVVSRFMQTPSKVHFGAAKRILRYIAGTNDYGVSYESNLNSRLYGFIDSDWTSSLDNRNNVSANAFTLGSSVITWSSKKQPIAALLTTEAEYIAATSAACQAIWLRRILAE